MILVCTAETIVGGTGLSFSWDPSLFNKHRQRELHRCMPSSRLMKNALIQNSWLLVSTLTHTEHLRAETRRPGKAMKYSPSSGREMTAVQIKKGRKEVRQEVRKEKQLKARGVRATLWWNFRGRMLKSQFLDPLTPCRVCFKVFEWKSVMKKNTTIRRVSFNIPGTLACQKDIKVLYQKVTLPDFRIWSFQASFEM